MYRQAICLALALLAGPASAAATHEGATWDGLELHKVKGIDTAYVRPDVTFKSYDSVLLDNPIQVTFDKSWDPNRDVRSLSRKLSPADIQRIRDRMSKDFREVFADELGKAGYSVVATAGENTLRVTAAIVDVYINAPDVGGPGRSTSYTMDSGRATLVMELRDGPTGQLLARVVDRRTGSNGGMMRMTTSVSNSADFRRAVRGWTQRLVEALDGLGARK